MHRHPSKHRQRLPQAVAPCTKSVRTYGWHSLNVAHKPGVLSLEGLCEAQKMNIESPAIATELEVLACGAPSGRTVWGWAGGGVRGGGRSSVFAFRAGLGFVWTGAGNPFLLASSSDGQCDEAPVVGRIPR